ncbi:SpvB/TcaC N-terminal domain-containing protein [Moorena sp. SIO3I6]|uniref:SpvB/TcaC N-terminal domain-containing protein n=1 Tax=Moorena sp. SIO3I6 TaxID=2607831 RepID=UPI0013F7E0E4|nr:SpvB/TcaC N-terminal domain-containing protein [Moorena sp. SIO3I6]NEP22625.1 sugar-binding protein [Moorena sp. SIO3I6]
MENSKITTNQLSLPKGGGAIQGIGETFQANEFTGTAGLSIPIPTTPCRGFEPQLSVQYSSGSGNGTFGLGFALAIPNIARKTSKVVPKYDETDIFLISNAEDLVPIAGKERTETIDTINYTVIPYRPRVEGLFAKIERWINQETGDFYWQTVSTDNVTSIFGKTEEGRIYDPEHPSHVFQWLLEETFDAKGNYTVYQYKSENTDNVPDAIYEANRTQTANKYIEKIKYGNDSPLVEGDDVGEVNWHFEVVFDYGEYDISPTNVTPYTPVGQWQNREDPFSTYDAGFEIRTHRLCRNILMFHRFEKEFDSNPILVHATRFQYPLSPVVTLLKKVESIGYRYEQGEYKTKRLPTVDFDYTAFAPQQQNFEGLLQENGQDLPGLNLPPDYMSIDLYGEGIPGVLYSDGNTTLYWESQGSGNGETGGVNYGPPKQLQNFPIERHVQDGNQMLMDIAGNGRMALVVSTSGARGYYQYDPDGDTWQNFQPFAGFPTDFQNPDNQMVDVTGDGLMDILLVESDRLRVYPSEGEKGFAMPLIRPQENDVPTLKQGAVEEALQFADIFGTGKQHLVRITDGALECWPNLGYGRFGKKIQLENAPRFEGRMDASRLFLVDIDGSGTADIAYVSSDRIEIWFNQSGNSFSEPLTVYLPSPWDSLNQINFADVLGNGTTCLVFSQNHIQPRHWYYDFCAKQKPYLLNQVKNNLGAESNITYASSTKYYLQDKGQGTPWVTKLPFPVQVVEKVETIDLISNTKLVSSYSYHHGYYDRIDRVFRGFGRVERQDAEILNAEERQSPFYVPPILTKTWYHTGAWQQDASLFEQYEQEYFQGDTHAAQLPLPTLDWGRIKPSAEEVRQAHVALKGTVLHSEVYGLDDSEVAQNPYSVSETSYNVKLLQPQGDNKYAVFYVWERESLAYDYERNPEDPRIAHNFTLEIDDYGHVLRECGITYGRREGTPGALPEQTSLKATYTENRFINLAENNDVWLLGVPAESKNSELLNISLPSEQDYFDVETISNRIDNLTAPDDYNLLAWEQHFYWDEALRTVLPLGEVSPQMLLAFSKGAVVSQEGIELAFSGVLEGAELEDYLANQGKYDFESGYWWDPGLRQSYLDSGRFYLPTETTDAYGNVTGIEYDDYYLLVKKVTDAIGNETTVEAIDYQVLQPQKIRDINDNTSEVIYDALGMVVLASYYGTENGDRVGFAELSAPTSEEFDMEEAIANPQTYLQGAASYFHYDVLTWENDGIPVHAVNLVAEDYPIDARVQTHISYSDGFGREVQTKIRVEPGIAFSSVNYTSVEEIDTDNRWLSSGAVVYNNKGNPVQEYEPYYIDTHEYVDNPTLNQFGVSSVLHYDPLQRVVRVDTPKGFFTKVEFTPWQEKHYDENDTIEESSYYQENIDTLDSNSPEYQALVKAAQFYNTPDIKILDNLGRIIRDIKQLVSKNESTVQDLVTHYELDIVGNQLSSADPRLAEQGYNNFSTIYDLTQTPLKTLSADGGTQWTLQNVMGNPIYVRDSRGLVVTTEYDVLHRPTQVLVQGGDGGTILDQVVERTVYGEDETITNPQDYNLRGQVYQHYDSAGLVQVGSYSITGQSLSSQRQLRQDYQNEADWSEINLDLLEDTIYTTSAGYDALGRVIEETDADGNVHSPSYDLSGLLAHLEVTHAQDDVATIYVENIDYSPKGQRTQIVYGNGVTTDYEYEPTTFRLTRILTQRGATLAAAEQPARAERQAAPHWLCRLLPQFLRQALGRMWPWGQPKFNDRNLRSGDVAKLQDLNYTYDAVGNITQIADNAWDTVFNNNQQVDPVSKYTYDSLYRLIEATGREHPALSGQQEQHSDIPEVGFVQLPNLNNGEAVENYIRQYTYDNSGNLYQITHQGATPHTRNLTVSETSNRAVDRELLNGSTDIDLFFDANGNQIQMSGLPQVQWNYRDNIANVTIIDRDDNNNDAEYYVYDSSGTRVRKVTERYGSGGNMTHIEEVIYLGVVEIRLSRQGETVTEERRCLRVMDDTTCVAVRNQWTMGAPPTGVSNPQVRYQLDNHLGSAAMEVDDGGQLISYEEYFPYGGTAFVAGSNLAEVKLKHYRYSGKERDGSTGLYYYGARYYAPWLGRWMSCDPAGTVDGLNLYEFVSGNPIRYSDNLGMVKGLKGAFKSGHKSDDRERLLPEGGQREYLLKEAMTSHQNVLEASQAIDAAKTAHGIGRKKAVAYSTGKVAGDAVKTTAHVGTKVVTGGVPGASTVANLPIDAAIDAVIPNDSGQPLPPLEDLKKKQASAAKKNIKEKGAVQAASTVGMAGLDEVLPVSPGDLVQIGIDAQKLKKTIKESDGRTAALAASANNIDDYLDYISEESKNSEEHYRHLEATFGKPTKKDKLKGVPKAGSSQTRVSRFTPSLSTAGNTYKLATADDKKVQKQGKKSLHQASKLQTKQGQWQTKKVSKGKMPLLHDYD